MRRGSKQGIFIIVITIALFSAASIFAAEFNTTPPQANLGLGQELSVGIKINSGDDPINAAQAKLLFSPDILEVKSISKTGSIFNFWLQEPTFSNTDGTIEFIGGTPNGVSGASLHVLEISFAAKAIGFSQLAFVDSSITASDGSGRNIAGTSSGASFSVVSTTVVPKAEQVPVPAPTPIIRTPVPAVGLPATPTVRVPLYPDSADWHNLIGSFTVFWDLPPDVLGIAAALNQNPNFLVPAVSEGLFESKAFPPFEISGTYYFHVRFQNNQGWGPTAHYRIAIDTEPPVPFTIDVRTGLQSDNPSPEISFNTRDALSGIESFVIQINDNEPILLTSNITSETVQEVEILPTSTGFLNVRDGTSTSSNLVTRIDSGGIYKFQSEKDGWYEIVLPDGKTGWIFGGYARKIGSGVVIKPPESSYKFSPLLPGKYMIRVKAADRAGNSIDDVVELEILSIEVPEITFAAQKVIRSSGNVILARGLSLPNEKVVISLEDEDGFLVLQSGVSVNEKGEWEFLLDRELRRGNYYLSAQTRDSRGAVSLSTDKFRVSVQDKPIISFAGIDITLRGLIYLLLVILVGSGVYVWRREIAHFARAHREALIITRDFKNSLANIRKGIDALSETLQKDKLSKENKAFSRTTLKKLEETIEKSEKYISQDIEKMS